VCNGPVRFVVCPTMKEVAAAVLAHLTAADPGGVVGLYVYGSAVEQLQADSDIDLLLVTRRSLTLVERKHLVAVLIELSGWRGHASRFPEVAHRRPLELTSLVLERMSTDHGRARRDFQYGEWLRADIVNDCIPQPSDDPDVVLLIASALSRHRVLRGPALKDIVPAVPLAHVREAVLRVMPSVIQNATGDERNALLTMARTLITLRTGTIVSKEAAAAAISPSLPQPDRGLMERARAGYLHGDDGDWSADALRVREVLERLARRATDLL
jgi:predicted nucleotidyltransferase